MSHRITWRSRPRSDYPWPLIVKDITNAERDLYGYAWQLTGPLTLAAVTELIYRVAEIAYSGTIATSTGSATISGTMIPFVVDDELQTFAKGWLEGEDENTDHERVDYYDSGTSGDDAWTGEFMPLSDSPFRLDLAHADIYKDEDGGLWLHGIFEFLNVNTGGTPWAAAVNSGVSTGATSATVNLVLSGVTHVLAASSTSTNFTSATITMTPTKWHAYKTTAGDPAWDTATGLPANGGPGA